MPSAGCEHSPAPAQDPVVVEFEILPVCDSLGQVTKRARNKAVPVVLTPTPAKLVAQSVEQHGVFMTRPKISAVMGVIVTTGVLVASVLGWAIDGARQEMRSGVDHIAKTWTRLSWGNLFMPPLWETLCLASSSLWDFALKGIDLRHSFVPLTGR